MPKGVYKRKSLVGQKFHHLTVVGYAGTERFNRMWNCRCSCGVTKKISTQKLNSGQYKSCGHLKSGYAWRGVGEISRTYWGSIKRNAKTRDFDFTITMEMAWKLFLEQNRKCVYTGLPLSLSIKCGLSNQTASLDRIDSSKGYIDGNVQWVHKDVNNMKWDFSVEYFLELCHLIVRQDDKNEM
tara:strand:- start:459 stop:1007 length:549 start_codon:yes stop_codon:yes gene_type:complete